MKKVSRFLCLIAVFVTVFAFSCMPTFAADVTFQPTMVNPIWSYYPGVFSYYIDDVAGMEGNLDTTYFSQVYAYAPFTGEIFTYSDTSLTGGYSYSGTFAINYNVLWDPATANLMGLNNGTILSKETYLMVDSVEFMIDGNTYTPFLTKTAFNKGTAYYTVKDLYVSATNRFIVKLHVSGYSWFNLGRSTGHGALDRVYVQPDPQVKWVSSDYKLIGTTSGFVDDLDSFDNSMNEGSTKENALSDKAIDDINSFEFKDIKDDSSILSSLTFYSSVINLAYGSLGSTVQTLFAVSFGVLIVIFILRIRRDSS